MKEVYEGIVSFLKNYQERTHVKGYVLGISGGKDSTVVAKLLVDSIGKENVLGVLMPNGKQADIEDSYTVCDFLDINYTVVNIENAFDELIHQIDVSKITTVEGSEEFNKELVLYGIDHVKSHFNPEYKVRLIETCCDICAGHDLGIPYNYSIKTCKKNFDSVCK